MWRLLKQLFFGAFYLGILGVVAWRVYNISLPIPTVPPPCVTCSLRIESAEVTVLPFSDSTSSLLVRIKNPSSQYGLKKLDYQFRIFDKSGKPIRSILGFTSLYPSEEKYIALSSIDIAFTNIGSANFEPLNTPWQKKNEFNAKPDIEIVNTKIEDLSDFLGLSGDIANSSKETLNNINIIALLQNENGSPVSIATFRINNIQEQRNQHFKVFFPKVKYKNYSVYLDL